MTIANEIESLEQRLLEQIESFTDEEAVKINLGNLNLLSVMKKKVYDRLKGEI